MKHEAVVTIVDEDDLPVSVVDAKNFCGVSGDTDDELMQQMILGATDYFQSVTGHQLMEATCVQKWDEFPEWNLDLDWSPVIAVSAVSYYAADGTLTTIDEGAYWATLEARPAAIVPVYGTVWPDTQAGRPEAVIVEYTAGYASADDINKGIVTAICQLVAHWYKNRSPALTSGAVPQDVPHSLTALMERHKKRGYR